MGDKIQQEAIKWAGEEWPEVYKTWRRSRRFPFKKLIKQSQQEGAQMAAHGRTGEALEAYRAQKNRSRDAVTRNAKTGALEKVRATPRYEKPSYLARKQKRAQARKS